MDNVGHFVDAARALATDHELWESMARAARAHAANSFSASTFIENHIKMYCAVLNNT
jgi:glycosyltransferase involved in cell wall biosynthesis